MSNGNQKVKQLQFKQSPGVVYQIYDQTAHQSINTTNANLSNLNTACSTMNTQFRKLINELSGNVTRDIALINSNIAQLYSSMPIGTIIMISYSVNTPSINLPPFPWLYCNGAKVAYADYPDLYPVISGTYAVDHRAGWYTLPDFRSRVPWGYNNTGACYLQAGLPNIQGKYAVQNNKKDEGAGFSGAFYSITDAGLGAVGGGWRDGGFIHGLGFKASLSNPIYGNSITVQPPAFQVDYYIKAK